MMRSERYFALAWCHWLLDNVHDNENFALGLDLRRRSIAQSMIRTGSEFHLSIIEDLTGEEWRQALDDGALAGINPPSSPKRVQHEGQMAMIYARHALGRGYDAADVSDARDALLKRQVNGWLLRGHAMYVAKWMKLFFWKEDGAPSAFETVRMAYRYLPGVTSPSVITA